MTNLVQIAGAQTHPAHLRRVQWHAVAALSLLAIAAIGVSFMLAQWTRAGEPELVAAITASVCLMGGVLIVRGLRMETYPHRRLGLCNVVTMTRGAGIAVLAGMVAAPLALQHSPLLGWTLLGLALATILLDAVDGWAARHSGLRSTFGARFDVESDVVLAIVLSLLAWQAGKVGIWFLALGMLRPAFLLGGMVVPALRGALPDARWRKWVAGLQMTVQVALLAPIVVPPFSHIMGLTLLIIVAISFVVDVVGLLKSAETPA